jgi:hypothetical protein
MASFVPPQKPVLSLKDHMDMYDDVYMVTEICVCPTHVYTPPSKCDVAVIMPMDSDGKAVLFSRKFDSPTPIEHLTHAVVSGIVRDICRDNLKHGVDMRTLAFLTKKDGVLTFFVEANAGFSVKSWKPSSNYVSIHHITMWMLHDGESDRKFVANTGALMPLVISVPIWCVKSGKYVETRVTASEMLGEMQLPWMDLADMNRDLNMFKDYSKKFV